MSEYREEIEIEFHLDVGKHKQQQQQQQAQDDLLFPLDSYHND